MPSLVSHVLAHPAAQLSSLLQRSHRARWRRAAAQCWSSRCCIRARGPGRQQVEAGQSCISRCRDRQVREGRRGQVVAGDPASPTSSAGRWVVVSGLPFSDAFARPSIGAARYLFGVRSVVYIKRVCPGAAVSVSMGEDRVRCRQRVLGFVDGDCVG
jgi:hypothetical protein